jgi:hypothetical protein
MKSRGHPQLALLRSDDDQTPGNYLLAGNRETQKPRFDQVYERRREINP